MTEMIRVVVVDDHPLFREGVSHSLAADPQIQVVGEGGSADDALRLAEDLLPDVILLDVSMPGGGINAASAVAIACPVVRIAMLTVSETDDDVMRALKAGAHGYILKGIGSTELTGIVKTLCRGEMYVSPRLAARLLTEASLSAPTAAAGESRSTMRADAMSPDGLTPREEQILNLIAEGKSNREIGEALNIAEKTVKNYVTNIFQKLHVRNRVEASIVARSGQQR